MKASASCVPCPLCIRDGKGSSINGVGARAVTGFWMGSGCFHHFCHLNTGSFPLPTQSLFLELPLSFCVCTQVEMFNKIAERKEGRRPALSVQVQVTPCVPSSSAVWCAQS